MKVLFLTREYPPYSVGGIAKYVFWLSRSLVKLGVKCKVLSIGDPDDGSSDVIYVAPESSLCAKKESIKDNLMILHDIKRMDTIASNFFDTGEFDVLHVVDPYLGPFIRTRSIVTTVHDTSVGELRFMVRNLRTILDIKYSVFFASLGPLLEHLTLKKSKAVIAVDEHVKNELCKSYGMPEGRIRVVANGVAIPNTVSKDTAKKRLGLMANELLIFSACRLIPRKRIDILIKAVRILLEDRVEDFSVVVCGDGPQRHFLLRLADRYGLSSKIRFPGWVSEEELQSYYEAADIFVLTSEYEGFPISLLEALAYGVAPVCSNISPMILTEGVNGLVFASRSSEHLAKKLKLLDYDTQLRLSISEAARELSKKFSWEKVAVETKGIYETLLAGER